MTETVFCCCEILLFDWFDIVDLGTVGGRDGLRCFWEVAVIGRDADVPGLEIGADVGLKECLEIADDGLIKF